MKEAWIGDSSTVGIAIKTLLGEKYLAVDPLGNAPQDPGARITASRTTSPYDVTQAFNGLGETIGEIDTAQLAKSFDTISATFKDSPPHVRSAADGLSALSRTVSQRDAQLATLLSSSKKLTKTLDGKKSSFETLLEDGNLLLGEIRARRDSIHRLLTGTRDLGTQLAGLVRDNDKQLGPTLDSLSRVTAVLVKNRKSLDKVLATDSYSRLVGNTLGSGRWFDNYVCGVVPKNYLPAGTPPGDRMHATPAARGAADMRRTRITGIAVGLALVAVAAATGVSALEEDGKLTVTAYFERATGVYAGSDLRILGVKVGTVQSVEPRGEEVKVVLRLDRDIDVPRDAHAVVVAPSLVADRYVQLAPAYDGGPRLADDAVLPAARNATPVEVDELYASITELSTALGPNGANADGAFARLLDTGAKNLDGNGKAIGDSIEQFGKATKTLDKSSGDLFDTLKYLQGFTTMLKENDGNVRSAEQQLNTVTTFLADDKKNLSAALKELGAALGQVKAFIAKNRGSLKKNVEALVPVTQALADQRASLAEAMDTLPLAAGNVLNAYDPAYRTLNGRTNLNELSMGGPLVEPGAAEAAG